jgi:glycosyltransferase involved in cell wall biosynthesis
MKTKLKDRGEVDFSIVLPAFNERENLEKTVRKTIQALEKITDSYEIIIAEDGSTDGTDRIASKLSNEYPFIRHIHSDERLGRGLALKNAFSQSKGKILAYMDVDLATEIGHLNTLINSVRKDYDFATGSRMLHESKVSRSLSRQIASKSYNFMVRSLLGSRIADHQCGFKCARREALLDILYEINANHWFWDTEMLVRASLKGYRVKEIPIEWTEKGRTKVKLVKDSLSMGSQILKLCWELRRWP